MVTNLQIQIVGEGVARVSWSTDEPLAFVYIDGVLVASTSRDNFQFDLAPREVVQVEVLDDPAATPTASHPGRVWISWAAVAGAVHYKIELHDGEAWSTVRDIPETGAASYSYQTTFLDDAMAHKYRVTPSGTGQLPGRDKEIDFYMVRRPDYPVLTFSLVVDDEGDWTGDVEVSGS